MITGPTYQLYGCADVCGTERATFVVYGSSTLTLACWVPTFVVRMPHPRLRYVRSMQTNMRVGYSALHPSTLVHSSIMRRTKQREGGSGELSTHFGRGMRDTFRQIRRGLFPEAPSLGFILAKIFSFFGTNLSRGKRIFLVIVQRNLGTLPRQLMLPSPISHAGFAKNASQMATKPGPFLCLIRIPARSPKRRKKSGM